MDRRPARRLLWMPTDLVRGLKAHGSSPAMNEWVDRLSESEH